MGPQLGIFSWYLDSRKLPYIFLCYYLCLNWGLDITLGAQFTPHDDNNGYGKRFVLSLMKIKENHEY